MAPLVKGKGVDCRGGILPTTSSLNVSSLFKPLPPSVVLGGSWLAADLWLSSLATDQIGYRYCQFTEEEVQIVTSLRDLTTSYLLL